MTNRRGVILTGVAILAIDQIIKLLIIKKIPDKGIFLIDTEWLKIKIELLFNSGLAFGLVLPEIMIFAIILIVIGWLYWLAKKAIEQKEFLMASWLTILAGGAYANVLDRIMHGGVVDYLTIAVHNFFWPTFNLADALIVVAVMVLIINYRKLKKII